MRADVSIKPERDHQKKKKQTTVRTSSSKQKLYNIGCALNIMYNQRIFHKKIENHIFPPPLLLLWRNSGRLNPVPGTSPH